MIGLRYAVSALLSVVLLFCLSGCTLQQKFILEDFQRDVSFEMSGITVRGKLSYRSGGESTFIVSEPENISGTVFSADEVSLPDIKISYGKTGDYSPVKILLSAVEDVGKREILLPYEGEYEYTPESSSAEYKIIFDCEKGEIKRIETEKFLYNFE